MRAKSRCVDVSDVPSSVAPLSPQIVLVRRRLVRCATSTRRIWPSPQMPTESRPKCTFSASVEPRSSSSRSVPSSMARQWVISSHSRAGTPGSRTDLTRVPASSGRMYTRSDPVAYRRAKARRLPQTVGALSQPLVAAEPVIGVSVRAGRRGAREVAATRGLATREDDRRRAAGAGADVGIEGLAGRGDARQRLGRMRPGLRRQLVGAGRRVEHAEDRDARPRTDGRRRRQRSDRRVGHGGARREQGGGDGGGQERGARSHSLTTALAVEEVAR